MRSLALLMALPLAAVAQAQIKLENLDVGETIRYPVLAVKGRVAGKALATKLNSDRETRVSVVDGKFATLFQLKPGANMLTFRSGRDTTQIKVNYRPMTNPEQVKTVWVVAADEGDGYRLAPDGKDPAINDKLDVAMKLLQSECAEAMRAAGYGRKTFPLEFDAKGKVVVHVVRSPKGGEELRKMGGDAWGHIYELLKPKFPEEETRWVSIVGWTDFDAQAKQIRGHFALGGGALAAFGSGSMPHWPAKLEDVPKVLSDTKMLNPETEFEDSAYRRTVWANVSTAYGAMIHELGHALGLPHSADPLSFMSRGFDHFNRAFCVEEPPRAGVDKAVVFPPNEVSRWGDFFSARLNVSPFLQPDAPNKDGTGPRIERDGDVIRLIAPTGVRVWGAENDNTPAVWQQYIEVAPSTMVVLSAVDLRKRLGTDQPYRMTVVDPQGRWSTIDIKD